jgi:alpha-1,6-mannosyltransferase
VTPATRERPAGPWSRQIPPAAVRWGGFAGSVATAASAWLGGSGFVRLPSVNPLTLLSGQRGVLLPICWVLGTALLISAWWYGRHVLPSTRWALLTAGLWLLPVLPFLPLGSADVYSYACQGYVQHAGGDPYAVGVQDFGCPWLDSVATSWRDSPAPYGPLFLILAAGVVGLAGDSLAAVVAGLRVIAMAGVALTAVGLPVLARRAGRDPARAVWLVLACPLVLVHLVSGAHNDALMIGLMVTGLALVARRSSPAWLVAGGAVLGLAVAVKATAIVVLPFAVLAAVPPGTSLRMLWRPAAAIGGGALLSTGLLSLLSGRGFGWVAGLARSGDSVTWGSPSTAVGLTVEFAAGLFGGAVDAVPVTRALGVVLLAVVLVLLWWRARSGGALPGAGLALAATVLCAPVFHPWYATWPLAVLAATGVRMRPPAGACAPAAATGADDSLVLLGLCAFAATLTLPAGYNWALYTRIPGAIIVTAVLVALAFFQVRKLRHRRVFA